MEPEIQFKKCTQAGCTIHEDGVCLENFEDATQCPHFYLAENGDTDSDIEELAQEKKEVIELFDGEQLTLKNVRQVTYKYPTDVVYLIGEHDSGKTTILATLFEMFQMGPFHEYNFAGSYTQVGFERRCYYSRIGSDRSVPDTERTKLLEFNFLHLALKKNPERPETIHLLLSDISGEKFKRARNSSDEMRELSLMSRAKIVNYVIDGEKLAKPRSRFAAINEAKLFIQKALDVCVFNKKTQLNFIVSKWDLLNSVSDFNYLEHIEGAFTRDFQGRLRGIEFYKIAVRPLEITDEFELGHGLLKILNSWLVKETQTLLPEEVMLIQERMINNFPA